jgi:Glycosyl hydrolases family 16
VARACIALATTTLVATTVTAADGTGSRQLAEPGSGALPPGGPPAAANPGRQWIETFAEEFTGTRLDRAKLSPCFDWNRGKCTATFNSGREIYRPSQVRVGGGVAGLIAQPLAAPVKNTACLEGVCTYASGMLSTARPLAGDGSGYLYAFSHGYVEARMKLPTKPGFFTAFWMLPADPSFDYPYEIDIVEALGFDPRMINMTYHYDNRSKSYTSNSNVGGNGDCPDQDYTTTFHTFGLDWQPDHVAWYIDGMKCQEFDSAADIGNVPMDLIVTLMVDNQWERDVGGTLRSASESDELQLDYIRVYQQR